MRHTPQTFIVTPRTFFLVTAALTAFSVFLGAYGIGHDSFWLDEAASLRLAGAGWRRLWGVEHGNMLLYYALLKVWTEIAHDESAVRALSLVSFVLTVPVVALLGRRWSAPYVGLLAAALVASHPLLVRYGQEARGYSLVALLVAAAVFALTIAVQDSRRSWAYGGTVLLALAAYVHPIAALTGVVLLAWLCLAADGALPVPRFALPLVYAGLVAPLAWAVLRAGTNQIAWTGRRENGGLTALLSVVWRAGSATPAVIVIGIGAIAGCWLVVARARDLRGAERLVRGLPLVWLVGTGIAVFVVSLRQSLLVDRYLLLVVPAIALLAADGLARWCSPRIALALVAVAAVINVAVVVERGGEHRSEDWRAAEAFVAAKAQPGDAVLFAPTVKALAFEHYMLEDEAEWPAPVLPSGSWGDLDVFGKPLRDPPGAVDAAAGAIASHPRVWVVNATGPGGRASEEYLAAVRAAAESGRGAPRSWSFGRVDVELYG